METDDQARKFTKEDSYRNLERVMYWISNSDQKMLVLAGIATVWMIVLWFSLMEEVLTEVPPLEQLRVMNMKNGLFAMMIVLVLLMILFFVQGMFWLLGGLIAKINQGFEGKESFLLFGSVAGQTYGHLREQLEAISETDLVEEIDSQVYILSILCARKLEKLKKGVQAIQVVFGLFVLLSLVLLVLQVLY